MSLADWVFPRRCLGCSRWGRYFCPDCLNLVKIKKFTICPVCFRPSILGTTHTGCLKPLSLDGLAAVFAYQGLMRKAIKKLKYRFVTDLVEELTDLVVETFSGNGKDGFPLFDSSWTLVPVPLHPRREKWRGFNQAEVLGRILARKMNWGFEASLLRRRRFTRPQAEVEEKKSRRSNIRWAFEIEKKASFEIRDSKLILFDDVWTTGSTIKECGQVLKRKRAAKVWGLTLAR